MSRAERTRLDQLQDEVELCQRRERLLQVSTHRSNQSQRADCLCAVYPYGTAEAHKCSFPLILVDSDRSRLVTGAATACCAR